MKNIHLIPTDKPSRLHLGNSGLVLCESVLSKYTINGQHIYITSDDEKLKQGDYGLSKLNEIINFHNGYDYRYYKKIIITTDQDLIADSVQAIDDTFLEWFVKNPSCEGVEVEDTCLEVRVCDCAMNENCLKPGYTIIFPQEEPKQELNLNCFDCNKSLQDCTCMEDTINMTDPLEQAAKEYAERHLDVSGNLGKYLVKAVFQDGVKWEQEQDKNKYSEEEVRKLFKQYKEEFSIYRNQQILNVEFEDWFEQFKKK